MEWSTSPCTDEEIPRDAMGAYSNGSIFSTLKMSWLAEGGTMETHDIHNAEEKELDT